MKILVTGGAGYVGSIVVEELLKEGYSVVVLDNLQQGHRQAVLEGAQFIQADIRRKESLEKIFGEERIDAVMHMAAETAVEDSMANPKRCFGTNIVGGANLLDGMLNHNVSKLIFSSSAAVYGEPQAVPIEEDHPTNPVNAYGESKLIFEHILKWYGKAYGLGYISLRYFNAAGATRFLGEDHHPETHLIPNVLKVALQKNSSVPIFGIDYPTRDGSCIRDYVHIVDIAKAHILALQSIEKLSGRVYNLGNGEGYSVLEVVGIARQVLGVDLPIKVYPRRLGDPPVLVASSSRAREELDWEPRFPQLETIIESAWKWMKEHPNGYGQ
ncbi:UDP-glucose 4-epimerase [subsurface metagenome]